MKVNIIPLKRDQRIIRFFISLVMLFSLLFFSLLDPLQFPLTTCGFKQLFGIPCPSCGLSRSAYAFAHFEWINAFKHHLMGPILFIMVIIFVMVLAMELLSGKTVQFKKQKNIKSLIVISILLIWLGNWLIGLRVYL